jgi:uncharacterized protein (TIGR02145 family)
MKIAKILLFVLLLSVNLLADSVTATYSACAIPTTYITSASVDTSSRAIDPGLLTVTIPVGAIITSVNVVYNMVATNGAYMSEQRSFMRCISSGGVTEPAVYSGVGVSTGTYSYNRTSLKIANNVIGGGNIQFELHAFRTYLGSGSNTTYSYVDNNSWQITVNYEFVDPPINFITKGCISQIILSWTDNADYDAVIIAYNTTNTFGTLINGMSYPVNSTISGGGTIIYSGRLGIYAHSCLNPTTQYFYKIWAVSEYNNYSIGVTGNASTNSAPVVSNVTFINNIPTTGFVDIYYDVTDAEQSTLTISMEVSNDGGATYNFACTQVTGDIGSGISIGTSKHIVWNFSREHAGESGNNFKIQIIADDLVGDQIYYAGKIYNTVIAATQMWLKENLDVGTQISGSVDQTNNGILEKYCYNDDPANCTTYGGLYQWNEAMQYVTTSNQGICPIGWHIPNSPEFRYLSGVAGDEGNALKAVGQGAGTNTSGFSALLAGCNYGGFSGLGTYTYFWGNDVYDITLNSIDDNVYQQSLNIGLAGSIRCLKN